MSLATSDASSKSSGGRPARSSRDEVVLTGLEILKSEGLAAVTLTAVGERLGLHKVGLYTYVRSKDDLLVGMRDEVVRRQLDALVAVEELAPEKALRQVCNAWAEISRDYGALLVAVQPEMASSGLEGGERFLTLLGRQGLGQHQQLQVYLLLVSFFDSFVTRSGTAGRTATAANDKALQEAVLKESRHLPNMQAMMREFPDDARTAVIDDMLSLIIDTIIPVLRT